ncbi:MAG TPA: succinic semialdehyde dehydrogenase [Acidimicrobiales bacterium]|nr:succinic semialdehyde dehydrogenase [Acidimicrobiales bacterium]
MTATQPAVDTGRPERLAPHVSAALLERLAGRAFTAAPRPGRDVTAPATGEVIAQVPHATVEDIAAAAAVARDAQKAWAARPVSERAAVLMRFADLVLDRQDEVLDLIQLENGKARRHAFEEVADVAVTCRYYGRVAPRALKPKHRAGAMPGLTLVKEHRHPKGLVGIISPWNYPLTLGISDALPALVAGNAVLAKPDSSTPFTALWAALALDQCGLPPGLLQIVTGPGAELGPSIIDNSDFVMFTGSTATGRGIAARAAERLVDASMELGGKNPLLVLDDADLDRAVPGAVRASFSNGGQLCISIERIYVHEKVWDEFVPRFATAADGLTVGHSWDYEPEMGSLVSRRQLETVVEHVEDAVEKGATLLAGGKARPDLGPFFHEPTVLTDVAPGMTLYADETFGPVVSLYKVASVDEAVERANDTEYGLNASVWTKDLKRGQQVATRLEAGTVNVNDGYAAAWASVDAPMGGWKASGVGRRHGEYGLLKYTEAQTVAAQRLLPTGPPENVEPDRYAKVLSSALRLMKRLPGRK